MIWLPVLATGALVGRARSLWGQLAAGRLDIAPCVHSCDALSFRTSTWSWSCPGTVFGTRVKSGDLCWLKITIIVTYGIGV